MAVLAVGGTYVYIHFIEGPAPAPFSLKPAASTSVTASPPATASQAPGRTTSSSLAGTWQVAAGSQAGTGSRRCQVTFALKAEWTGGKIEVSGSIPVAFADYAIGNPSFGSFVTTQNRGVLEFLIDLTQS